MGIFGKKKKVSEQPQSAKTQKLKADLIVFEKLTSDEDAYLTQLAQLLMDGAPLILNFEPLDIDQANKVIAFFSGVIFAATGEIVHVKEKVFMFASKDVYLDGSMEEFLKEIVA